MDLTALMAQVQTLASDKTRLELQHGQVSEQLTAAQAQAPAASPNPAANWPSRAVRVIVAATPGGGTDVLARLLGQRLGESMGQQFVIENRPGAGGIAASEAVARAPA